MPKYISGRFKKTPQSALSADRYRYLSVGDSEPNLGDSPTDQGTPNLPTGQQYIVVGFRDRPGERFWIPNQGGIIPGSLSIFEEGTLVGGLSSTTQLNFVGQSITAEGVGGSDPGVAVTITVAPPGNPNEVLFVGAGGTDFDTDTKFTFDSGLLAAGDRITVGTGGTVITTTGIGSVGIGTTEPTQKLHLNGNFRITGTIYDSTNQPGSQGDLLVKGAGENLIWVNQNAVTSGAGGTIGQIQFHSTAGVVDGADNFYFDFNNNRVGIGSTQPTQLLDVLGVSIFTGDVNFIGDNYNLLWDKSQDSLEFKDETKATFGDGRDLQISHTNTLSSQTDSNGDSIVDGRTSFIEENGSGGLIFKSNGGDGPGAYQFFDQNWHPLLKLHGGTNARALLFHNGVERIETTGYGVTINGGLRVSGIATIQTLNLQNLSVPGISTLGNVVVNTNTISTKSGTGNLIIDSDGSVEIKDPLLVSGATESTSKDSGSIITEGGIGVEKSVNIGLKLNVGDTVSFSGPSVGIAVTLAGAGGITTTGGDLYVNGNVLPSHDATSNNDSSGKDIGASNINWRKVYAQEFVGGLTGNADKATNLAGGAAGSIPYQSASDTTVFLAEPNADNKVLSYNNTSDAPTWIDLDKIEEGNTSAEVIDTGSDGHFKVTTEGSERLRIGPAGQIGLSGANYGTANKVLTSNGPSAAPTWEPIPDASIPDKIEEGNTSAEVVDTGTDGHFKVLTEGTERFRITADGRVGIGTTNPYTALHIHHPDSILAIENSSNTAGIGVTLLTIGESSYQDFIIKHRSGNDSLYGELETMRVTTDGVRISNTNYSASAQADELIIGATDNGNNRGLTIASGNLKSSSIYFGDNNNNAIGTIIYSHALDALQIATNGSERLRIGSAGQIGLGGANYGSATQVLTSNGSSNAPTWQSIPAASTPDKIEEDNTSAEVVDTGTDGHFKVTTEGTERFRIGPAGIATFNNDLKVIGNLYLDSTKYLSAGGSGSSWGSVQINGDGGGGYEGYSIDGRAAFVHDGSTTLGLYDDVNDHWVLQHSMQATDSFTKLYSGNNTERFRIGPDGQIGLSGANYGSATQVLTSNGPSAAPTWQSIPAASTPDKIQEDNTSAEVVDTGTDGHFKVLTEGTERFRIGPAGIATFTADITAGSGNPGQINIDPTTSTSNGRIKYSGTKTFMIEGGTNSDNKIEIHGHQNSLNILCEGQGETELYFNGNKKLATTDDGITVTGISSASEGFDFEVQSSGTPVTTNSVKILNFSGTNNTITYDASTKTVDIDIDSGSGGGGVQDKIQEDNTSAEVVDTGTDGHFKVLTEGTERFRIGPAGIATFNNDLNVIGVMTAISGAGITVTGISSATEGFDFGVNSSGTPVTTGSVKTLNFSGTNNTITYDASTKTVDIDIDGSSGSGGGTVASGTFTAVAGSPSTLNTYAYDSAELVFEYTVFVKNGSDYQSQKLLVMRDGTTVHSTQYGVMYSNNPLVELDATISGSNLLLRATPETGVNGSTTYRLKREIT